MGLISKTIQLMPLKCSRMPLQWTLVWLIFMLPTFNAVAQFIVKSGSPCVGSENYFIYTRSSCSDVVWSVGGSNYTIVSQTSNSIRVKWNSAQANVYVAASYSCSSAPNSGIENYPSFTIASTVIPSVTISSNNSTNVCAGNFISFTAAALNAGSSPDYSWRVNGNPAPGSTSSPNYVTNALTNGQLVTCVVTSSNPCSSPVVVTSNSLTATVNPLTALSVSLTGTTTICSLSSFTLSAAVSNPIGNLTYQWKKNGVNISSNSSGLPSYVLMLVPVNNADVVTTGDVFTCVVSTDAGASCYTTGTSNSLAATITTRLAFTVSAPIPKNSFCQGESVAFAASSSQPISSYKWEVNGIDAPGQTASTFSTTASSAAQLKSVKVKVTNSTGCLISPTAISDNSSSAVTVVPLLTPPTVIQPFYLLPNTPATLTASGAGANESYRWYTSPTLGSPISTTTPVLTSNTTYYVTKYSTTSCESNPRVPYLITMNNAPTAVVSPDQSVKLTNDHSLNKVVFNGTGSDIEGPITSIWTQISGSPTVMNGNPQITIGYSLPGNYVFRFTVTDNVGFKVYKDVNLLVAYPPNNYNYIIEQIVLKKGITTGSGVDSLTVGDKAKTIQYFDGLGRPLQTVSMQASPGLKNDIVQPIVYDEFGREIVKYLPFTSGNDGWFKTTFKPKTDVANYATTTNPQYQFYQGTATVAIDVKPYAETLFEASPLNRTMKQGAPGAAWQPNTSVYNTPSDNALAVDYQINIANEVLLWTFSYPDVSNPFGKVNAGTAAAPDYYAPNQLQKNKSKDEHHNEMITYVDKDGHTILKRVQAVSGNVAVNDTNYASTYYIYDDFGSLVYVIPPEAVKQLATGYYQAGATDVTKDTFLKQWAFRYAYDARHRMNIKQVPGAGSVYMVYDNRDRLVMTQDANQRTSSIWTFTKYDALNRPVLSGIYTSANILALMQAAVDTYYAALPGNGGAWFESYNGTTAIHGYTNLSFPLEPNANNYLSVTYYDNTNYQSIWHGLYAYTSDALSQGVNTQPATGSQNLGVIGLVTGTKVKVLDDGAAGGYTWLKTATYYDDKYRVIQVITDNYKGGTDRISNLYDFVGKVLKSKTTHTESDVSWKDMVSAQFIGNVLKSSAVTSGAASVQQLAAGSNGWLEVTYSEGTTTRFIGLNDSNPDAASANIDYAFRFTATNTANVYENNVLKATITGVVAGDVFKISRTGTAVKYYRNGLEIILSPVSTASSTLLMADASFSTSGATLTGVRTSFSTTGKSITRTLDYDHASRLINTWHQVDNGTVFLLAKNEYNGLGQLVDKKLHSTVVAATDAKQSVDYRYNIRGWLTSLNDAALTLDGAEPKDYFGMNLAYNNTDLGIGNTGLFNGNISGMTWSNNQGLGTIKQNGYVYTYDPMNRIASSSFKEWTSSWAATTNNGFAETGYSYDLNGNIKTMQRNDKRASGWMDNMTYSYGTGSTQSNKLLRVNDAGDKFAGFVDDQNNNTLDDYTYDANGNLTRDINKGIGTTLSDPTNIITYNYLNLPETITKGGGSVRYIYDATGRKLSQVVTTGAIQKQTDYVGEFTYENDALQYISHEEGRIMMSSTKLIYADHGENAASITTRFGATLALVTQNGTEKYVQVTSSATLGSGAFAIGGTFPAVAGERYKIRVKGYRSSTGASGPFLLIKASGVNVDWPGAKLPLYLSTECWIEQIITIPTGATTLEAGVVWNSAVGGEVAYLNEFEIIKLETTAPEYQYNLKDHLGNVRLTFTTKPETDGATATLEAGNANAEKSKFVRYDNARIVKYYLFDKTNGSAPTTVSGGSQRLSGKTNEIYGLGRSLSVMPGDAVNMEVYAKYIDSNSANRTAALNTLISQIASLTAPAGTVIDGGTYASSTSTFPFSGGLNGTAASTGTGPKAYLNWLVFDRNYTLITSKCGYQRMTTVARETGQDIAHEKLMGTVSITEPGYVYIYLSNEEGASAYEVYFDEFKVDQVKSPVIQTQDYYPFGLTYNSYSRENATENRYLYNQGSGEKKFLTERVFDLGLNVDQSKYRTYDYLTGRWWQVDPKADEGDLVSLTPYNYSYNNPILYNDPEGDCPWCIVAGALIGAGLNAYDQYKEGTLDLSNGKSLARLGTAALSGGIAGSGLGGLVAGVAVAAGGEAADQVISTGKVNDLTKVGIAAGAGLGGGLLAKGAQAVAVKTGLVAIAKSVISSNSTSKLVSTAAKTVVTSNSRQNVKLAEKAAKATVEGVNGIVSYAAGKVANTALTPPATTTTTTTTTTTKPEEKPK